MQQQKKFLRLARQNKEIESTTLIKVWKSERNNQKYYSNIGPKLRRDIVHRKESFI